MIAALFVQTGGCYFGLEGVDPWDVVRNAMKYGGRNPAVCHPDCARWGRYWSGGPSCKTRKKKGDDGGQFAFSLATVRRVGGVIEHPADSSAWEYFDLNTPPRTGGWVAADFYGGWTCCVEQGHYGHRARKATFLYVNGVELPSLTWGPSQGERLEDGFHSSAERHAARALGVKPRERLSAVERLATPVPFREVLLSIARSAKQREAA